MDGLILPSGRSARRHQLSAMHAAGAHRVTVVSSRETGALHAFALAREHVHGDVLVLSSDALFPQQILRGLLHRGSALAFDSRSSAGGERVEVSTTDGRLIRIGRDPDRHHTDGEHLGLLHLTEDVAQATFDAAAEILQRGDERQSLVKALNVVARRHPIACVDIAGLPWVEIDFPEDPAQEDDEVGWALEEKRAVAFPSHA
jgi:choline kinase